VDSRQERKARNEALHRKINDNLEQVNEAFGTFTGTFEIVCECSDLDCLEHITISIADYHELRTDPTRFAVVEGHEDSEVEFVVARTATHLVVQKKPGEPATVATELA
jgi:hypothetical protein